MDDFKLVEAPIKKPWCCAVCQTQKGPIADTFVERWGENIYLCRYCTDLSAKAHGLTAGPQQQAYLNAADVVLALEKEVADLKQRDVKRAGQVKELRATVAAVEQERDDALGKVAQFEHLIGAVRASIDDPTTPVAA